MARMFNVKSDRVERYKLQNAISRLKLMQSLGRYDPVEVYGRVSDWKGKRARHMITVFEARLKELS